MRTTVIQKYFHKSFILKCIALLYSIVSLVCAEEMAAISSVNRRNGDLYSVSGMRHRCDDNYTLLVDERRCVSDHELINSKEYNTDCLSQYT